MVPPSSVVAWGINALAGTMFSFGNVRIAGTVLDSTAALQQAAHPSSLDDGKDRTLNRDLHPDIPTCYLRFLTPSIL